MKKTSLSLIAGLCALTLLTGCLSIQLGGGASNKTQPPTIGQQLTDLQKAKDSGAITDAEYQAQKTRLLQNK